MSMCAASARPRPPPCAVQRPAVHTWSTAAHSRTAHSAGQTHSTVLGRGLARGGGGGRKAKGRSDRWSDGSRGVGRVGRKRGVRTRLPTPAVPHAPQHTRPWPRPASRTRHGSTQATRLDSQRSFLGHAYFASLAQVWHAVCLTSHRSVSCWYVDLFCCR
jgi:hypothetical protein